MIKGIFVKSHINALKRLKGDKGLKELQRRYRKPINFKNSDNVPVREEIKIIELVYDILNGKSVDEKTRAHEAGRLHFKNFVSTPFARIIFPLLRKRFKTVVLNSRSIASHVFRGVNFRAEELGEKEIRIIMENADYPIEHFNGLLSEWMAFSGISGKVESDQLSRNAYAYLLKWK